MKWFRKKLVQDSETGWGYLLKHSKNRINLGASESEELLSNINTFIVAFYKLEFDMNLVIKALEDGIERIRKVQLEEKEKING